jgi:hypothetical protein
VLEGYSQGYSRGTHRGTRGVLTGGARGVLTGYSRGTRGSLEEYSPLSLAPPIGPTPFLLCTHARSPEHTRMRTCTRAPTRTAFAPKHARAQTHTGARARAHTHTPLLLERSRAGTHDRAGWDTSDAQRAHVDPRGGKPHRRAVRWAWPTTSHGVGSPRHICAGTGLTQSQSAPGFGSPCPHLHRD